MALAAPIPLRLKLMMAEDAISSCFHHGKESRSMMFDVPEVWRTRKYTDEKSARTPKLIFIYSTGHHRVGFRVFETKDALAVFVSSMVPVVPPLSAQTLKWT